MISRTSEYALRALIYLAQESDRWPIAGKEIAEVTEIPPKYLSTILSALVRTGVLESSRGKSGGFWLARSSKEIYLADVLLPFEQATSKMCPFGNRTCSDVNPCSAHHEWKQVKDTFHKFIENTSLYDVEMNEHRKPKKR